MAGIDSTPLPSIMPGGRSKRDLRFWFIFFSICVSLFLSALDFTGVSTILPTIVNDFHGSNFVWVGSGYSVAATAVLPLSGGLSEVRPHTTLGVGLAF